MMIHLNTRLISEAFCLNLLNDDDDHDHDHDDNDDNDNNDNEDNSPEHKTHLWGWLELGLELLGGSRQRRGTMQIEHSDDDEDDDDDDDSEYDDNDGDDDDNFDHDDDDDVDDDDDDLHNPPHPLGHCLLLLVNAIVTSCWRLSQDVEGHVR